MLSVLYAVVPALAMQFGGREGWVGKPYAKVTIVAHERVPPGVVEQHLAEVKLAVQSVLRSRPRLEEEDEGIAVEIRRVVAHNRDEHEQAAISTSVIMAMTVGGAGY